MVPAGDRTREQGGSSGRQAASLYQETGEFEKAQKRI